LGGVGLIFFIKLIRAGFAACNNNHNHNHNNNTAFLQKLDL
jgi:hypothetical protein